MLLQREQLDTRWRPQRAHTKKLNTAPEKEKKNLTEAIETRDVVSHSARKEGKNPASRADN